MRIIPLTDYPAARRPTETRKSQTSWARDARSGKIPGAFQFTDGGDWYVDLDTHDATVRRRVTPLGERVPNFDEDVLALAKELGISEEEARIASNAARG